MMRSFSIPASTLVHLDLGHLPALRINAHNFAIYVARPCESGGDHIPQFFTGSVLLTRKVVQVGFAILLTLALWPSIVLDLPPVTDHL